MSRQAIGVVEFRDLWFKTRNQIHITRFPDNDTTLLFLDQDIDGQGVLGQGDIEVGFDKENTRLLLTLVQEAISTNLSKDSSWHRIGEAIFSWSDHARESEAGEDHGTVLIETNGSATRVVIRSKEWHAHYNPYVATFSSVILSELSALLSRALHE